MLGSAIGSKEKLEPGSLQPQTQVRVFERGVSKVFIEGMVDENRSLEGKIGTIEVVVAEGLPRFESLVTELEARLVEPSHVAGRKIVGGPVNQPEHSLCRRRMIGVPLPMFLEKVPGNQNIVAKKDDDLAHRGSDAVITGRRRARSGLSQIADVDSRNCWSVGGTRPVIDDDDLVGRGT